MTTLGAGLGPRARVADGAVVVVPKIGKVTDVVEPQSVPWRPGHIIAVVVMRAAHDLVEIEDAAVGTSEGVGAITLLIHEHLG